MLINLSTADIVVYCLMLGFGLAIYLTLIPTILIKSFKTKELGTNKKIMFWSFTFESLVATFILILFWDKLSGPSLSKEARMIIAPIMCVSILVPVVSWLVLWEEAIVKGKSFKAILLKILSKINIQNPH
jgi:hypothetical protein